jgi:gliding motility associated protien GldN
MMKNLLKVLVFTGTFMATCSAQLRAQEPETVGIKTEASEYTEDSEYTPKLDDVTEKSIMSERQVLAYQPLREADIMWERTVWRILDAREKMNLPFAYPEEPFAGILLDGAKSGNFTIFAGDDEKFTKPMDTTSLNSIIFKRDTVTVIDPETYEEITKVVDNSINLEDIKRFRIKEKWFFDKNTSTMNVRILGIAPMIDIKDNEGNFRYELPMFWIYYPECRELFARHQVFNMGGNIASTISWEDLLEMRYFSSYIYKESNVYDRRLQEYLTGVDLLLESDKIKNELFNYEHDLWSY